MPAEARQKPTAAGRGGSGAVAQATCAEAADEKNELHVPSGARERALCRARFTALAPWRRVRAERQQFPSHFCGVFPVPPELVVICPVCTFEIASHRRHRRRAALPQVRVSRCQLRRRRSSSGARSRMPSAIAVLSARVVRRARQILFIVAEKQQSASATHFALPRCAPRFISHVFAVPVKNATDFTVLIRDGITNRYTAHE
ncbi:hypothetical protein FGB62_54g05 [Gracilaria domingensis]|nr:hypothetical protein FGB62_54g05 [Gracilaria domingensis]